MTMTTTNQQNGPAFDEFGEIAAPLAKLDAHLDVERVDASAVAVLNRSEVEAQIDAAHKHPRRITRFIAEATSLATLTREIASSCIYALPRGGKTIPGPSVRLAEICASAYGNLHAATRVVGAEATVVIAQGIAWDLEKNLRIQVEAHRRILDRDGHRYNEDMITMTGNAAASIALRNAIFRVIPRAYVDTIYAAVRKVAVGDQKTLSDRRAAVLLNFEKLGVTKERVLEKCGKPDVEGIDLEALEMLIGLGTAIRSGDLRIDDAFPKPHNDQPAKGGNGGGQSLEEKVARAAAKSAKKSSAESAPADAPPAAGTVASPTASSSPAGGVSAEPAPTTARATCALCKKPVGDDAVPFRTEDGAVGLRHPGCPVPDAKPQREPGED